MHIIIPTFEKIKWMPPTVSLIKTLCELGHTVTYITIFKDDYYEHFDSEKVKNVALYDYNDIDLVQKVKFSKIAMSCAYRIEILIRKILAKKVSKVIKNIIKEDDVLWIVNEMTVNYAKKSLINNFKNYIFTIYELEIDDKKSHFIKKAAQKAKINVVPEYNRAHIIQALYQLEKTPIVLPNKSIDHPRMKNIKGIDKNIYDILDRIKKEKKRIVVYSGIIGPERRLDTLIEAIDRLNTKFELVILGRESNYLRELLQKYPKKFTYLGYKTNPEHLPIISQCDIGVLFYIADRKTINPIYCAPNKIFEYTGFGLPVICNDIPALKYTAEQYKFGLCVDISNVDDICDKLEKYDENYDIYSKNSKVFFESLDIKEIINRILIEYKK